MEIGSFIDLELPKGKERYKGQMDVARLNTGRAAIWHAFRVSGAKAIWIPYYQCETVREFLTKKGAVIKYYHQNRAWNPTDLKPEDDEAVLLVNYYGIMSRKRMRTLASGYKNVIIDNCQGFFCDPIEDALNIYSARKFVGVADGAYVVGKNAHMYVDEYEQGYSSDTAGFLLMRVEYGCSGKGYEARTINEERVDTEDIMKMSKLTHAMLDGADYEYNRTKRKENFAMACEMFGDINKIDPKMHYDDDTVPMVYPLVVEDDRLLGRLLAAKHFQGHWWAYVTKELPEKCFEHWLSRFIIPITIDQRYGREELDYLNKILRSEA